MTSCRDWIIRTVRRQPLKTSELIRLGVDHGFTPEVVTTTVYLEISQVNGALVANDDETISPGVVPTEHRAMSYGVLHPGCPL